MRRRPEPDTDTGSDAGPRATPSPTPTPTRQAGPDRPRPRLRRPRPTPTATPAPDGHATAAPTADARRRRRPRPRLRRRPRPRQRGADPGSDGDAGPHGDSPIPTPGPPSGHLPLGQHAEGAVDDVDVPPGYLGSTDDPTLATRTRPASARHRDSRRTTVACRPGTRTAPRSCSASRIRRGCSTAERTPISARSTRSVAPSGPMSTRTSCTAWMPPATEIGSTRQDATTGALTVPVRFTNYAYLTLGDGEGGICDDDRTWRLFGYAEQRWRALLDFNLIDRAVVGRHRRPRGPRQRPDQPQGQLRDGRRVGSDTRRYSRNLAELRDSPEYGTHGDNDLDANGNEIYVTCSTGPASSFVPPVRRRIDPAPQRGDGVRVRPHLGPELEPAGLGLPLGV